MNVRILFKSICILLVMLAVSAPLYAVNNDYKLFESAIRNNDVTAIQNLVSSGADVNAEDDQGLTVLMCAVATSHNLDITRMLLEAGANVNARTEGGVSALVYAVFIGNTEAVRMLLDSVFPRGCDRKVQGNIRRLSALGLLKFRGRVRHGRGGRLRGKTLGGNISAPCLF